MSEQMWERVLFALRWVGGLMGSMIAWVYGKPDDWLYVLVAMVAIDYFTGFLEALVHKRLDSRIGFRGIARKVMIFALVGIADLVDKLFPGGHGLIHAGVCAYYIANEGLSILENAGRLGLPIPDVLKNALAQLSKSKNKED